MTPEVVVPARPVTLVDRFLTWGEKLSDRFNPLVVKEVRQGLRTRVFWICFTVLLSTCVVIALIAYANLQSASASADGQFYFCAFYVALGIVHFFVLPYTAFRALSREREDDTWLLLTLTGLGPRRILRGKLGSSLIQATLYGSAILPFLLLSYYLNGIDLPTILRVVGLGALYTAFLLCVAISLATVAESRIYRGLAHFAALGGLGMATMFGLQMGVMMTTEVFSFLRGSDFWPVLLSAAWSMLGSGVLFFEAAASRLSLPTENYAIGPRLAAAFQLFGTLGVTAIIWLTSGRPADALEFTHIFSCFYLALVGMFLALDRDGQAVRHRQTRGWRRIFTPGALRGFRWAVFLLFAQTAFSVALYSFSHTSASTWRGDQFPVIAAAAPAYVLLYLSLAIILSRWLPVALFKSPAGARLLFVILSGAAMGLPPLFGAVAGAEPDAAWLNTFNPMLGLINVFDKKSQQTPAMLASLCIIAVLLWWLADAILSRRDAEP